MDSMDSTEGTIAKMLAVDGHKNSLGKVAAVIEIVLQDRRQLGTLYDCLFDDDAWVRMRAADALEKICREQPDWLLPYVDRCLDELGASSQPSIQWHLAQIYRQVSLTAEQKHKATAWLANLLSSSAIDWIVAANAMETLAYFTNQGDFKKQELLSLLMIQQQHKFPSVVKRAAKLASAFS